MPCRVFPGIHRKCASRTLGSYCLLAKVLIQPSALKLHFINDLKPPRTLGNSGKLLALFYWQTKSKLYQVSCSRSNWKWWVEPKSPKMCKIASSSSCYMIIVESSNELLTLLNSLCRKVLSPVLAPCQWRFGNSSGITK